MNGPDGSEVEATQGASLMHTWSRAAETRWMKGRTCWKSSVGSPQQSGHQLSELQSKKHTAPFTPLAGCYVALSEILFRTVFLTLLIFCLLLCPSQLRDMCVQDWSVWTQVWWVPPGFLPLQQHWLPAVPVSQPHQLLPSTVRWVCWPHRYAGVRQMQFNMLL